MLDPSDLCSTPEPTEGEYLTGSKPFEEGFSYADGQDTYEDSAFDDLTREPTPHEIAYDQAYFGIIRTSQQSQESNPEDKLWLMAMLVIPVVVLFLGAILLISR